MADAELTCHQSLIAVFRLQAAHCFALVYSMSNTGPGQCTKDVIIIICRKQALICLFYFEKHQDWKLGIVCVIRSVGNERIYARTRVWSEARNAFVPG